MQMAWNNADSPQEFLCVMLCVAMETGSEFPYCIEHCMWGNHRPLARPNHPHKTMHLHTQTPVTCDMQYGMHATCDMQHVTCNMHVTCDMQCGMHAAVQNLQILPCFISFGSARACCHGPALPPIQPPSPLSSDTTTHP